MALSSVIVVPYDPAWPRDFERESQAIQEALGDAAHAIHHIGSTSIPRIHAKPIIDLLVELTSLEDADRRNAEMEAAGFTPMGEFGIRGRRYFRRVDAEGVRRAHVHGFSLGFPDIDRHLAFRDFLRAHPDVADDYSRLKQSLATQHPEDIDAYMDGKDPFIKEIERRALEWTRG